MNNINILYCYISNRNNKVDESKINNKIDENKINNKVNNTSIINMYYTIKSIFYDVSFNQKKK
jgi:hypothetical protein